MAFKFPKKAKQPYLQPMMLAIQAAMKERQLSINGLLTAMGWPPEKYPAVSNWVHGKNGPGDANRPILAQALGLDEALLIPTLPPNPRGTNRPVLVGPAQRAVALVRAAPPGAVTIAEPVRDVFTIAGRSDGQIAVQLRATLDAGRGMALARFLLDFGLIVGDEPANEKGASSNADARGRD